MQTTAASPSFSPFSLHFLFLHVCSSFRRQLPSLSFLNRFSLFLPLPHPPPHSSTPPPPPCLPPLFFSSFLFLATPGRVAGVRACVRLFCLWHLGDPSGLKVPFSRSSDRLQTPLPDHLEPSHPLALVHSAFDGPCGFTRYIVNWTCARVAS